MALSAMELQLGDSGFYRPHGNKHKQSSSMIFVHLVVFHACLSSHSVLTHLTNHGYLKLREKPKYPLLESHAGIKMVQVLGSPVYICGEDLNIIGALSVICNNFNGE